jgi:hypothetical protein
MAVSASTLKQGGRVKTDLPQSRGRQEGGVAGVFIAGRRGSVVWAGL